MWFFTIDQTLISVPIEKEVKAIDKNGGEITKNTSYRLKFIDGARLMASSLSNLVNNLANGIHKIKCQKKSCESCGIRYRDCEYRIECTSVKYDLQNTNAYVAIIIVEKSLMKF